MPLPAGTFELRMHRGAKVMMPMPEQPGIDTPRADRSWEFGILL